MCLFDGVTYCIFRARVLMSNTVHVTHMVKGLQDLEQKYSREYIHPCPHGIRQIGVERHMLGGRAMKRGSISARL